MWKLEKTDDKKYPYLITIEKSEKTNLKLLVQKKWPSDDESVFCVRHDAKPDINAIELVEEDEISSVRWLEDQTKVSIKLNRTTNQQCEFRFVKKNVTLLSLYT